MREGRTFLALPALSVVLCMSLPSVSVRVKRRTLHFLMFWISPMLCLRILAVVLTRSVKVVGVVAPTVAAEA